MNGPERGDMQGERHEHGHELVLIDDKPLARLGLKHALETGGRVRVVGEASSARAAFEIIGRLRPAVVVTDLWLPGLDGISTIRDLRARSPQSRVVVFTGSVRARDVSEALDCGAFGYVAKPEGAAHVLEAVNAAIAGQRYLSPAVMGALRAQADRSPDALASLSAREREVFALVVRGFSNQQIARELCVAVSTVGSHRRHLNEKLNCHGTSDLFRFAVVNDVLREPCVERLSPGPQPAERGSA